jgi:hypothetical protein
MEIKDKSEFPRKYLQFPLFLLKGLFSDKQSTFCQIIKFGIYKFAKSINYDLTNVARQVIYRNYNKELPLEITLNINRYKLEYFGTDEDYKGFTDMGTSYDPSEEISEILNLFKKDNDLKNTCINHYCVWQALDFLAINGDSESILNEGYKIEKIIPKGEVMAMIGKHLVFDFRDNHKTEFEQAQLLAYIAINSIVGTKKFSKTNRKHIVSRMFGYASFAKMSEKELSEIQNKYLMRYHFDRVIQQLELNWNICTYSNKMRGIYISMNNKFPLDELIALAEKRKQSNRIAELKKKKLDILNNLKQPR